MRVAIAGAGKVGRAIARELIGNGHQVLLIDRDGHLARPGIVEGADVLVADACEISALEEARLSECQVVVAATGDDKVNLVVSLLAKTEYGVPRVVARVNHPKNEWMFNENWGVDQFVSTPQLITSLVEEAVNVGKLVELLRFDGGLARLVEVKLNEDSPIVNKTIKEIDIPRDATIVAILREEHLIVPRGDSVFYVGDEVLALVTPDSEDSVRHILTND